jgi:hypothetical protein
MSHSRIHVVKAYESLTSIRKQAHSTYLASLPNYDIYMRYNGRPPISHVHIVTLQTQIQEAHFELKKGIDTDWRASVLRYPIVLDYFYSLIELRLPNDRAQEVVYPPFSYLHPIDIFKPESSGSLGVSQKLHNSSHGNVLDSESLSFHGNTTQ